MRTFRCWASASLAIATFVAGAAHAETVRIGIVAPMSGTFAYVGRDWKRAMDAYQKINGETPGGQKLEFLFRDLPDLNPPKAKALAQELVVRDKVQYIGGLFYTPDAAAIGDVSEQAKVPTVIFNATLWTLLNRSQYLLRTSYTQPQLTVPMARYALDQNMKRVSTIVSDYATGVDTEAVFSKAFAEGGGTIVDKIRVPMNTMDFGPFMQSLKTHNPQAILAFTPGGAISVGLVKAYHENGLKAAGIRLLSLGGEVEEQNMAALGEAILGVESAKVYTASRDSAKNDEFKKALASLYPDTPPDMVPVQAFDGLHVIYRMIEATKDQRNGDAALAAVKGLKWESPRGPVMVDPASRALIQNIYIRMVERGPDGKLFNRVVKTYDNQPDYGPTYSEPPK
jgi:branched-chain amino acid transport system substrate-binding protein